MRPAGDNFVVSEDSTMPILLRMAGVVGATLVLMAVSADRQPSQALIVYQWCASFGGSAGATNCGFATYEQCRNSLAGGGGSCYENPLYNPPPDGAAPAQRRSKSRSQQ